MKALLLTIVTLSCCLFISDALAASATAGKQRRSLRARSLARASAHDKNDDTEEGNKQDPSDDDDDDDDDETSAGPAPAAANYVVKGSSKEPAGLKPSAEGAHSKEEAELKKMITDIEEELSANLHEQAELRTRVEHLEDEGASNKEIDANAKLVANETDSVAMATMLARMWKEMRMFEVPFFAQHVEEELKILKKEEKELDAKLEAAEARLAAAKKKWAKEAAAAEKEEEEEESESKKAPAAAAPAPAVAEDEEKEASGPKKVTGNVPLHHAEEGSLPNAIHSGPSDAMGWMKGEYGQVNVWFWDMNASQKRTAVVSTLFQIAFCILMGYLYYVARFRYKSYFMAEVKQNVLPYRQGFSFSLFSCFTDYRMCLLGCCCGAFRWADTLDQQELLPFWKGVALMCLGEVLSTYTYGISGVCLLVCAIYYRQKLRERFQIESKTLSSIGLDCLAWCCCSPCAIIQEAREEAVHRGG